MRRAWVTGALLVLLLAGGCSLKKDNSSCTADPGLTAGGGSKVCTRPPPTQFNKLGQ